MDLTKVEELRTKWGEGNSAGRGYYPCDCLVCSCDINEMELGTLLHYAVADDDIAIYRQPGGELVGVGQVYGAWAVLLEEAPPSAAREWFEQFNGDALSALNSVLGETNLSGVRVEQDWESGATILDFPDCSSLIFDGPSVTFEEAYAIRWHRSR